MKQTDQSETTASPGSTSASPKATYLSRWLRVVAFGGWLATLCALVAPLWWPLELATHFRPQYVIVLTLCAFALLAYKDFWVAGLTGACVVLHAWVLLPLWGTATPQPASHSVPVRGIVANIHGMNRDYPKILRYIRQQSPDFVVLVEVSPHWVNALQPLKKRFPYHLTHPNPGNFGIALFSRLPARVSAPMLGEGGFPSVVARIQYKGKAFTVLGTHPPPPISRRAARLRNQQFEVLARVMRGVKGPALLVGDLNTSPWSPFFRKLLKQSGLRDSSLGFGFQPTWPAGLSLLYTPIDHILVSPGVVVTRREIGPDIGSDHFPVLFEFVLP